MTKLSHQDAHILIQQDDLSKDERLALASHLELCDECWQFAATHRHLTENLTLHPVRQTPSAELREQIFERSRKNQRRNWLMKTVPAYAGAVALIFLVALGWLMFGNSPGVGSFFSPAPPLVPSEVIQGTWAVKIAETDNPVDAAVYRDFKFEFSQDGEFKKKQNFLSAGYQEIGTYEINESVLQYTRETITGADWCSLPSTEQLEVVSIEQNKIELKVLTTNCEPTSGSEEDIIGVPIVLERCEWAADAETNPFATCEPTKTVASSFEPAPSPAPTLVLDEVIVGTWATDMPDPDYDDFLYDNHVFEFKRNGEYVDNAYVKTDLIETGSYVVDGSTLQYTREYRPTAVCIEVPSTEEFEVISIEQNKITLKILTHPPECAPIPEGLKSAFGAELVLKRCEWPPNAETDVFAFCTPIESE